MGNETYCLIVVLGLPLLIVVIAMLGGCFYQGGNERLLDWKPTRSPSREAELQHGETDQMLASLNRYRRMRGAPERTLEQVTASSRVNLAEYID
ncbi:MAG: hypothetical protein ABSG93_20710 [Solirubrobacteraceae bacterium]|jgi:hypothetical protein